MLRRNFSLLLNKNDIEDSPLTSNECSEHKQPLISFCYTHDLSLCAECPINKHEACKKLDYELEFSLLFSNFSFPKLLDNIKSYCNNCLELLPSIEEMINFLIEMQMRLTPTKIKSFFEKITDFERFEFFCTNKINPIQFCEGLLQTYTICFKEKYNEVYKIMKEVQMEFKLLESNFHLLNKLIEKQNNQKILFEKMAEIDISNKKLMKTINSEFKLKNLPIKKTLSTKKVLEIIKGQFLELMENPKNN